MLTPYAECEHMQCVLLTIDDVILKTFLKGSYIFFLTDTFFFTFLVH